MLTNSDIKSFDQHLDEQYGKQGTASRAKFEQEFEVFKLGLGKLHWLYVFQHFLQISLNILILFQ